MHTRYASIYSNSTSSHHAAYLAKKTSSPSTFRIRMRDREHAILFDKISVTAVRRMKAVPVPRMHSFPSVSLRVTRRPGPGTIRCRTSNFLLLSYRILHQICLFSLQWLAGLAGELQNSSILSSQRHHDLLVKLRSSCL